MAGSLHASLIGLVIQAVHSLPRPLLRALDAWSARVARRKALARQRKWQQGKAPMAQPVPIRKSWYD